jgi:hypothetical protein
MIVIISGRLNMCKCSKIFGLFCMVALGLCECQNKSSGKPKLLSLTEH